MDWVATAFTFMAIYMMGSKNPKVARNGFLVNIAGSVLWSIAVPVPSIWVVNGGLAVLNARGWWNKRV
jgi:hypothetical protein